MENIADLAGLAAAYDGYRATLAGEVAAVQNGFSGDQQFFLAFAVNRTVFHLRNVMRLVVVATTRRIERIEQGLHLEIRPLLDEVGDWDSESAQRLEHVFSRGRISAVTEIRPSLDRCDTEC